MSLEADARIDRGIEKVGDKVAEQDEGRDDKVQSDKGRIVALEMSLKAEASKTK